jgi:hypothetical protein
VCDKETLLMCPVWRFGDFFCLLFTEQRYPCGWEIRMWMWVRPAIVVAEKPRFDTAVLYSVLTTVSHS